MGYAAALGDGLKRQMLLNMVRMRYADVPAFVAVSQLISGYTLQGTGQAGLNAYPNANPGNYATLSGTVQYTTRPTFTFTPVRANGSRNPTCGRSPRRSCFPWRRAARP